MTKSCLFIIFFSSFLLSLSTIGIVHHAVQVPETAAEVFSFSVNEMHHTLNGKLVENIPTVQVLLLVPNRTSNDHSLFYLTHISASNRHNFLQPNKTVFVETVLKATLPIFNRVLRI